MFSGEHLLCVRLRPANIDASAGSLTEIRRIVEQIRQCWPQIQITLRGDSGFCRDELMSWCEDNGWTMCSGLPAIRDCERSSRKLSGEAARQWEQTQKPARVFVEFPYQTTTVPGTIRGVW